jgi:predicted ATPase/DNA-binding CsgD family transcriptional regulator
VSALTGARRQLTGRTQAGSLLAMTTPTGLARHSLPVQLTSFVGREAELAEVARLLGLHRLLTLTGAGGIGKTRLALEVAAESGAPDGVWAVELASVADPARVAAEVAAALGLEPPRGEPAQPALLAALADRDVLLVLDNCEHLVGACAELAEALLRGCPRLRLLATSRERLGVPGEAVYPVPPLASPDRHGVAAVEELARYGAVRLFLERARLGRPDFALTEANAAAVARVCRQVDGIPLAIELAAARVRALGVEEIAARLDEGPFRLLTAGRGVPPRQQTLAAAIDWSYGLLAEPERPLLRRLSVFIGGFALDAAEAVCGGDDILDGLTGLVDKSLVVAQGRYRLLEPIRQFAAERLAEAGEAEALRARHRDWYLHLAERAVPGMIAPDQVAWFERLEAEHDNLRAALDFSRTEPNPEAELRLVGALAPFWARSGHVVEVSARLDDVLPRTESVSSLAGRRARVLALDWRGFGDPHPENAERAVALARELGDRALLATALRHLAFNPAHGDEAGALLEEAMCVARAGGVAREVGYATAMLARLSLDGGDLVEGERLASEALAVLRQVGDRDALRVCLRVSAEIAHARGDRAQARARLEEAVAVSRELQRPPVPYDALLLASLDGQAGDFGAAAARLRQLIADAGRVNPAALAFALAGVAELAAAWADPRAAARLLAATARQRAFHGVASRVTLTGELLAAVRTALGEEAFAAAWAEGERMSTAEAIELALSLKPPAPTPHQSPTPLSPREQEVARLIAEGCSNRDVAERLVIAEATTERHVANIFNKLGVHSRAQVAAWVAVRRTDQH